MVHRLFVVSESIRVWDLPGHRLMSQFTASKGPVAPWTFVERGTKLLIADWQSEDLHERDLTTGREVRVLTAHAQTPGDHTLVWDGRDQEYRSLPAGVYFCRLEAGGSVQTAKLALLK